MKQRVTELVQEKKPKDEEKKEREDPRRGYQSPPLREAQETPWSSSAELEAA